MSAHSLNFSSNWALNQVYIESSDVPNRSQFRMDALAPNREFHLFTSYMPFKPKNEAHQR